ncbi:hypothetical protein CC86DRAFT_400530 [Ophiobolus disseminans]|uniref:Uncharacterized protein n=1 Tax=Ophiobolus disseminans TaxID=1469910 RepID=A0A6A7ALB4_9PLEO|nr:hypothetical protein CC86DRAFT_400530 [Ophiobolus disseminans]
MQGEYLWSLVEEFDKCKFVEAIVHLYLFAKSYDIPHLRQDAIDRLAWYVSHGIQIHDDQFIYVCTITEAYNQTKPGSPLRKLLGISFALHNYKDRVPMIHMPKQYLVDV